MIDALTEARAKLEQLEAEADEQKNLLNRQMRAAEARAAEADKRRKRIRQKAEHVAKAHEDAQEDVGTLFSAYIDSTEASPPGPLLRAVERAQALATLARKCENAIPVVRGMHKEDDAVANVRREITKLEAETERKQLRTLRAALVPVLAGALDGYDGPTRTIHGQTFPKPFTEAVQEILVGAVPVATLTGALDGIEREAKRHRKRHRAKQTY